MLSGKLLPIHFKPQPDELLSSWLIRLAVSHGVKPYRFWNAVFGGEDFWRKNRVDNLEDDKLRIIIVERTGASLDRVVSTTLSAYSGYLYETSPTHGFSTWILPLGDFRTLEQTLYGLQFCPLCLAEDKEPYFRRRWRLSFVVFCERHKVILRDRCTQCSKPVNFYMNVSRGAFRDLKSFTKCHNCMQDLRSVDSALLLPAMDLQGVNFQESLINVLREGWAEVSKSGHVHSYLYFQGLYWLMSGLIRNLQRIKIFPEKLAQCFEIKERIFFSARGVVTFERLDTETRSRLLAILRGLLGDWPDGFIDFCKANHLWCRRWIRGRDALPFWCNSVIYEHLNRARHRLSEQEIDSVINYIRRTGREPSKVTISQYLGTGSCEKILRTRGFTYRNKVKAECPSCRATGHQYQYGLTKRDGHPKIKCHKCERKYTLGLIQRGYPEELRIKARQLRAEGVQLQTIADRLSVSRSAVCEWIRPNKEI